MKKSSISSFRLPICLEKGQVGQKFWLTSLSWMHVLKLLCLGTAQQEEMMEKRSPPELFHVFNLLTRWSLFPFHIRPINLIHLRKSGDVWISSWCAKFKPRGISTVTLPDISWNEHSVMSSGDEIGGSCQVHKC